MTGDGDRLQAIGVSEILSPVTCHLFPNQEVY
jgi:hypothetical protein